jgi:hypothetical protein
VSCLRSSSPRFLCELCGRNRAASPDKDPVVDGRAVRTTIKLGLDDGVRAEVLDGVKEGDTVITESIGGITDGQMITVREQSGAQRN